MMSGRHNIRDLISKKRWDEIYENENMLNLDRNIPKVVEIFSKCEIKKVLDLACGSGRHTLYLAKKGFEVYGIDISEEGIKTAKSLLHENNLHRNLIVGSIYERLPYRDNFFCGVISIRSLNHGTIEDIRKAIQEIERVLKPKGLVYVTVRKRISKEKRLPFKEIAPRTYIPLEGKEKGVTHYLFNKELLRKEFSNFRIHRLEIDYGPKEWEAYYCLLGELKIINGGDDDEI